MHVLGYIIVALCFLLHHDAFAFVGAGEYAYSPFVPYPHQKIFDGFLNGGQWVTQSNMTMIQKYLPGVMKQSKLDPIQKSMIREGVFVPLNTTGAYKKFYIFTQREAHECLRDKKVNIMGDSYMQQMYIGLLDILLGEPSNHELTNGNIRKGTTVNQTAILHSRYPHLKGVQYLFDECRHDPLECYRTSILNNPGLVENADASFLNVLVHHFNGIHAENKTRSWDLMYIEEMQWFMARKKEFKLTWVSGPSYHIGKVGK
jgi:hypothetical protein